LTARHQRSLPSKGSGALAFALAFAWAVAGLADEPTPRFAESSDAWGLRFLHHSGAAGRRYMMETNSGGVVLFDYDRDGDVDVLFIDAGALPGYEGEPARSVLYRNDGPGVFRDVTDRARLIAPGYNNGGTAGDVDGDGDLDLYLTAYGANQLFLNRGDGTFTDATTDFGVGGDRWTSSAAFADFDRDGLLDIYAVSYLDYPIESAPTCKSPKGIVGFCHPQVFVGDHDQFFRNVDGRRFEDATARAGLSEASGKGLGLVAADFDNDGWTDAYVANDTTPNFFFRNLGDGTFEDVSVFSGTSHGDRMTAEAGMGVTFGDVDGDGLFDLFVTNFDLETNALYRNIGGGLFTDVRHVFGIAQPSLTHLGFGTDFSDLDQDGDLDLLIANGHIMDNVELSFPGISYEQPNQLLVNQGDGRFQECDDCGIDQVRVSRGLATGDLDGDADLDIVVVNTDARAEVYENVTLRSGGWLLLDLVGGGTNTFGIGTRIGVRSDGRSQVTEAVTATSYLSQKPLTRHFGLGAATEVERIELRWPGGQRQTFAALPANRRLRLVQRSLSDR
jgi:hypothetical protein